MASAGTESTTEQLKSITSFRTLEMDDNLRLLFGHPRTATYAWVAWSASYWTGLVLIPALVRNELNTYQYYLWFFGMIGICSVYYCTRADHAADSAAGKPVMAMTCVLMSLDWSAHAFAALEFDQAGAVEMCIMFGHSVSILWASLFFYNRAIKNGKRVAWLSLLLQWVDIVFCCISILVIHSEEGDCLDLGICVGYFVVLILNLFFWFFPVMFGFSDTERSIHLHMVILDSFTDLPLVIIIILSDATGIHWWIFLDIAFKLVMLLRTYAFHLVLSLLLRGTELKREHAEQKAQMALQNELWEKGVSHSEIEERTLQLIKQQTQANDANNKESEQTR